jgi:hypothetical protein
MGSWSRGAGSASGSTLTGGCITGWIGSAGSLDGADKNCLTCRSPTGDLPFRASGASWWLVGRNSPNKGQRWVAVLAISPAPIS